MKVQSLTPPTPFDFAILCPGCGNAHGFSSKRWQFNGNMNYPTISPSLLVESGNEHGPTRCHSFVRDGKIQFLDDCTHALKGKTVDLLDWDDEEDDC
jgi:hypothetical protein